MILFGILLLLIFSIISILSLKNKNSSLLYDDVAWEKYNNKIPASYEDIVNKLLVIENDLAERYYLTNIKNELELRQAIKCIMANVELIHDDLVAAWYQAYADYLKFDKTGYEN